MVRFAVIITVLVAFGILAHASDYKVRYSVTPETVRVVLDLPKTAVFSDISDPALLQAVLNQAFCEDMPVMVIDDPVVASVALTPTEVGLLQITVTLKKARKYRMFTLSVNGDKPDRLVIDVYKRYRTEERRALTPGVAYTCIEEQTDDRYLRAHYLEVDPRDPHVRVEVAAAQDGRERVSAMTARTGAVCGVNGGFFIDGTRPVGLLKAGGRLISLPIWGRAAAAFPPHAAPVIGHPRGCWRLTLPDGAVRDLPDWLDVSVQTPPPCAVVYSAGLFTQAPANPDGLTVLIRAGKVAARGTDLTPLAPGDLALRLAGDDAKTLDPLLPLDACVSLVPVLDRDWDGYANAVGAGPRLLKGGKLALGVQEERIKPDIANGRNARTGLGVTAKGALVLAVVEGPGVFGGGATLEELANLLLARGAADAMNLDGGGSTGLAIGSETVNYPPGTWIRPVASGVLVFDDRLVVKQESGTANEKTNARPLEVP